MEDFERVEELTKKRIRQRKQRRRKKRLMNILLCSALVIILLTILSAISMLMAPKETAEKPEYVLTKKITTHPEYSLQLLPVNEYSRPGTKLEKVNGVVVHYTGNPGTTAQQNHGYFEGLAESGATYASSHFIIGLSGEIIYCVPLDEIAYASNERNADTISIECCINNEDGRFTEETYDALIRLTAWLVGEYDLEINDIIRHYDVTGKLCPIYYVNNPDEWELILNKVNDGLTNNDNKS